MFFQIRAFTVGMIKKGEINNIRIIPRPRNASCNRSEIPRPKITEIKITPPTSVRVFKTETPNAGSVKKKS